jgi:hypothetical protein
MNEKILLRSEKKGTDKDAPTAFREVHGDRVEVVVILKSAEDCDCEGSKRKKGIG